MKKQPELTALTRNNLIDAYFQLYANNENPTVGAISDLAGYNRCTFYRYFSDTEQLLYEVETEICDAFLEALPKTPISIIPLEVIESLVSVYQKYGNYLSVLLGNHSNSRFINRMKNIIRPMASQLFATKSASTTITELKVEFALSAVLATVTKWYDMGQPITIEQLSKLITATIKDGLLNN